MAQAEHLQLVHHGDVSHSGKYFPAAWSFPRREWKLTGTTRATNLPYSDTAARRSADSLRRRLSGFAPNQTAYSPDLRARRKRQPKMACHILVFRPRRNRALATRPSPKLVAPTLQWSRGTLWIPTPRAALLQVRLNRDGCLRDVTQVRLAPLVQRGRHANDDGVCFLQAREIRRRRKMPAIDELAGSSSAEYARYTTARIQHIHFVGSVSNPVTLCPASPKRSASGNPNIRIR